MRRTTALLAVGAITAFGCLTTSAASATEEPAFHTVLWEVTSHSADVFETPQLYVETFAGDDVNHWLTAELKCGTKFQADAYAPEDVASLIADGVLKGGEDGGIADHWLVWSTPDCVQPLDESTPGSSEALDCATTTVTITNWHDTVTYLGDKYGYTAQPAVRVPDPDTTRPATAEECPVVVVDEPKVGTAVAVLASTGFEGAAAAGIAALLLLAGLAARFRRRIAGFMDRMHFGEMA